VSTRRDLARRAELAGVEERGMYTQGFSRNLGALLVSASSCREGRPIEQPRPGDPALAAPRSEARVRTRYRRPKETKGDGTDELESESLIVPTTRGNAPERTPSREGEASTWTRWGDR